MEVSYLKIGAKIIIISKANVHYEGLVVDMDTENLQIALLDVHFYGTEGRGAKLYMADLERRCFKYTDIKFICIFKIPQPEEQLEPPNINGFFRHDPSQSTVKFIRNRPPVSNRFSSFPRICSGQRSSPYMYRIPHVVDFIGRSGYSNELPVETKTQTLDKHDFKKNNQFFADLVNGIKDMTLNNVSNDEENERKKDSNNSQLQQCEQNENEQKEQAMSNTVHGAIPKTGIYKSKSKSTATAYDKSKSFFDTISCTDTYNSYNRNPNWREWKKDTYDIPIIRHQRPSPQNATKAKEGGNKFGNKNERVISVGNAPNDVKITENLTVTLSKEHYFKKNNQFFADLVNGINDMTLNNVSNDEENERKKDSNNSQLQQCEQKENEQKEQAMSSTVHGAIPKTGIYKSNSKSTATAYDKSKSFFDTISCTDTYSFYNRNPNGRAVQNIRFQAVVVKTERDYKPSSEGTAEQNYENFFKS